MGNGKPFTRIDKTVDMPVEIGNRIVRPVARLKGWYIAVGENGNGLAGAALNLMPTEVEVQEGENSYSVAIVDPLREPLRKLLVGGVIVSTLSLIVMLASRLIARRTRSPYVAKRAD